MVRWSLGLVLGLGLASCGSEPFARAQLGEMCGIDEPVRLLALEPDQILRDRPLVLGDQVLISVARQPYGYAIVTSGWEPDSEPALWSSGPCGESPRRVAEDVDDAFISKLFPETLIAERVVEGGYVRLDPAGVEPPNVIAPNFGKWTTYGVVAFDPVGDGADDPASLTLYPYPDDPDTAPPDPITLLDAYRAPQYPFDRRSWVRHIDDIAWVVTTDGQLLRIDIAERLAELDPDLPVDRPAAPPTDIADEPVAAPAGAVTRVQTDVRTFDVSPDGRYLLWQDLHLSNDDPERPEGAVLLQDLHTSAGVSLAQTGMNYSSAPLGRVDDGVLELTLPNDITRIYFLPGLDFVDLPRQLRLFDRPLPDGRWLLQSWRGGPIYLADLHDLESTTVLFPGGEIVRREADGLLIADLTPPRDFEDHADQGPLWFAPFDASPAQRRGDAVSRYFHNLPDGRLLTVLSIEKSGLGELVLIDPETGSSRAIDHKVATRMTRWKVIDDVVRYPVVDGARTGVWAVRLPPRE